MSDAAAEIDHSHDRLRSRGQRALRTSRVALIARAISMVVSLVSIPLVLHDVGVASFGVWAIISSTVALLNFADFGIGNSLLNHVARLRVRGDERGIAALITTATFAFIAIAAVLATVVAALAVIVNWANVFRVADPGAAHAVTPTLLVAALAVLLSLPLSVAGQLQLADQEGWRTHWWSVVGQLLALIDLVIAVLLHASLPVLVAALMSGPLIAQLTNTLSLFGRRPELRPRRNLFDRLAAVALFRGGLLFLFLQLAWTLAFASDNLIIDRVLGPVSVTSYSVPYRAFTAVAAFVVTPLSALWPAYTHAAEQRDVAWLRRTLARSLLAMGTVGVACAVGALIFGRSLLHLWVGHQVVVSTLLLAGFALWLPIFCVGSALGVYLNALGIVRLQVTTVSVMVVSNVGLSIWLVRLWGPAGAVFGSIFSYTAAVAVPCAIYLWRTFADDHVMLAASSQISIIRRP